MRILPYVLFVFASIFAFVAYLKAVGPIREGFLTTNCLFKTAVAYRARRTIFGNYRVMSVAVVSQREWPGAVIELHSLGPLGEALQIPATIEVPASGDVITASPGFVFPYGSKIRVVVVRPVSGHMCDIEFKVGMGLLR